MPRKTPVTRYTGVAISLHWLIALMIIGLLVIGKFMTSLNEADPLRFELTQWHKSFGILVLFLSLIRVLWRLTHKPPALPADTKGWEKVVSHITHFLIYFLILALPLSGWIMVSTSPLNLSTILFNVIPFPHLPVLASMANKAEISGLFHEIHHISSGIMIVLLLLHIAGALTHQFIHRDVIMTRMWPDFRNNKIRDGLGLLTGGIVLLALGLFLAGSIQKAQITSAATTHGENSTIADGVQSNVKFKLILMEQEVEGTFGDSTVTLNLDDTNPAASSLTAEVQTNSSTTTDPQVNNSLPGPDWFDVENHPVATFVSTALDAQSDSRWQVSGDLTIRETTRPVEFVLERDESGARANGSFTINRLDFEIGSTEQPDDSIAGFNVLIEFDFPLENL